MSIKKVLARRYRAASRAIRRLVGVDVSSGHRPEQTSGNKPETGYFYLGPDLALVRLKNGHILYVDPQDHTMSAQLIAHGHWETWVYAVVLGLVSSGDTVMEVGANLGYYTVAMAAAVGPGGSVTAFEANPRIAALANRSIGLNGLGDRVTLVPKAVLDQPGEIRFMTSRSHSGGGFVTRWDESFYDDGVELRVEAVRLDDLAQDKIDFIRIDAEGSEPFILHGAAGILQANPDIVICMEWSVFQMASRTSVTDFINWLSGQGFQFWRIEHDSSLALVPASDMAALDACDVVLSRRRPRRL